MLRQSLLLFCATVAWALLPARAQETQHADTERTPTGFTKTIVLWPEGAPLARGREPRDIPRLYFYPPTAAGVDSAVIVMPGGGYVHEMMEKEGATEAKWLAARGVAAFVLRYRLGPEYRFPVPMLDGARAVRFVRSHAAEFGVQPNRIGVWGFSAGGHLAGWLATGPDTRDKKNPDAIERVSAHPDFAIFSYARLSMDGTIPRSTNLEALLGPKPTQKMIDTISIVRRVDQHTSPSFIYSTSADQTVNSLSSTAYYDALKRAGVPVELHIFELGAHGTGLGMNLKGLTELEVLPSLVEHWMQLHDWMAAERPLAEHPTARLPPDRKVPEEVEPERPATEHTEPPPRGSHPER